MRLLLGLLLCSLAACDPVGADPDDDDSGGSAPAFDSDVRDALTSALEEGIGDLPAHGCTIGLARGDGATWRGMAGLDAPVAEGGELLVPLTPFGLASVSKTYTAGLVLVLVDDGTLTLADSLEQHLPGVHPRAADITVEMLLRHRSGIPGALYTPEAQASPARAWTEDELFALVADDDLLFEPGASYAYSNTNYMLLARISQAAAGTPWRLLMEERLFDPLELDGTRVPALGADWGDVTPSWYGDSAFPVITHPQAIGAAGNLVAHAEDVARWGQARFGGTLLSAELTEEQGEGEAINSVLTNGLGAIVIDADEGPEIGHNGALNGFATWLGHRPHLDTTLALLCNTWGPGNPPDLNYPLAFAQDTLWPLLEE